MQNTCSTAQAIFLTFMWSICCLSVFFLPAFAIEGAEPLSDGAYLIEAKTSYVNPDTGKTADGGKDSPVGKIMCERYVGKEMLLEKTKGQYYLTFSMTGTASLQEFKVEIVGKDGAFRTVDYQMTYTNEETEETHYRVQMQADDRYISPSFLVEAMHKHVQFFITPNTQNAVQGTGTFQSEMLPKVEETTTGVEPTSSAQTPQTTLAQVPTATHEAEIPSTAPTEATSTEPQKKIGLYVGTTVVAITFVAVLVGSILNRRDTVAIQKLEEKERQEKNKEEKEEKCHDDEQTTD